MSKYKNSLYPDKINDLIDNNGNINADGGLKVTTNDPVDYRLVLSWDEMRTMRYDSTRPEELANTNFQLPNDYFCICSDDGKIYLYDASNEEDLKTGKFRLFYPQGNLNIDNFPVIETYFDDLVKQDLDSLDHSIGFNLINEDEDCYITFYPIKTTYDYAYFGINTNGQKLMLLAGYGLSDLDDPDMPLEVKEYFDLQSIDDLKFTTVHKTEDGYTSVTLLFYNQEEDSEVQLTLTALYDDVEDHFYIDTNASLSFNRLHADYARLEEVKLTETHQITTNYPSDAHNTSSIRKVVEPANASASSGVFTLYDKIMHGYHGASGYDKAAYLYTGLYESENYGLGLSFLWKTNFEEFTDPAGAQPWGANQYGYMVNAGEGGLTFDYGSPAGDWNNIVHITEDTFHVNIQDTFEVLYGGDVQLLVGYLSFLGGCGVKVNYLSDDHTFMIGEESGVSLGGVSLSLRNNAGIELVGGNNWINFCDDEGNSNYGIAQGSIGGVPALFIEENCDEGKTLVEIKSDNIRFRVTPQLGNSTPGSGGDTTIDISPLPDIDNYLYDDGQGNLTSTIAQARQLFNKALIAGAKRNVSNQGTQYNLYRILYFQYKDDTHFKYTIGSTEYNDHGLDSLTGYTITVSGDTITVASVGF